MAMCARHPPQLRAEPPEIKQTFREILRIAGGTEQRNAFERV